MIFVLVGLFLVSSPLIVRSKSIVFDWQDNGQFLSAMNCDFFGGDLSVRHVAREECESRCSSTEYCNAFTWCPSNEGGTCYLKLKLFSLDRASYLLNASCGLRKDPVKQPFIWEDDGIFNWSKNCDFWGGDMRQMKISSEECRVVCSRTFDCNAYTWSYSFEYGETCYLKNQTFSIEQVSYAEGAFCGHRKESYTEMGGQLTTNRRPVPTSTTEPDDRKETTNPEVKRQDRSSSTPETGEQGKTTTPEAERSRKMVADIALQTLTDN